MTREEAIKTLKENCCTRCPYGSQDMDSCDIRGCDEREAIKTLEQEPCEDCVSRQTVKEQMIKYGFLAPDMTVTEFVEDELPHVTPIQRWIPVSERLPKAQTSGADDDYSDWVQVTLHVGEDNDVVCRAYYCFSDKKWYSDTFVLGAVTAWMPLPEPYKAEREVKE